MEPSAPTLPPPKRRRFFTWRRCVFAFLAALPCLWLGGVGVLSGWQLARPPGREAGEQQRREMADPTRIGLRVQSARTGSGIPYFLVTPDPVAGPGERGAKLRAELAAMGETLPAYGFTDATMVLLHGRNSSKDRLLGVAERFAASGFRCLIPDLPGHGELKDRGCGYGAGAGEAGLAREVADDATARFSLPTDQPRLLWGFSMGGSFAIHAAAAEPADWAGLVVVASFARLDEVVIPHLARWSGPGLKISRRVAGWAASQAGGLEPWKVRPATAAAKTTTPTLILHGDEDPFIPVSQGRRLFESLGARDKSWVEVKGANHWTVLGTPQPVYAEMTRWARQHARSWTPPETS
ncbi:MAG: alpha/beta hydrolase [Verrucomicrobiales bacterium]